MRLKYFDFDSSFAARASYYAAMGLGSASSYTGSAKQNRTLIETMKKNGFSKGGVIGNPIKMAGETGFVLANPGEVIFNEEQFKQLRETMKAATPVVEGLAKVKFAPTNRSLRSDININIGDINMEGVNDPQEFARQLKYNLQSNPSVKKIIQSDTLGVMTGQNSLTKYIY